ncbi:peptidoglycan-binding protein LysM [Portibacter lacus]|uniref:Potassium binding protein Kbp n=1 Tax=Portibacter lacus TaxID=1099794 RepID=A0AA37STV3_9BACT|nr:peptidoglycan-binding protein LysM [Portibacter lacus]GLR20072.1 peptidoglycan-binding protein LysM [Portibacter lacus]
MGLFSFFKKAGSKKLNEEAEAAKAEADAAAYKSKLLGDIVKSLDIDIEDLEVSLDDDVVTVSGSADSQADKEKVILALGNVEGIAAVDDRLTVEVSEPAAVFYEVKGGDSLSKIAKAHYGDAMKYMEIFEANKPLLKDPNQIYPGQVLRIPPLD